jgi:hypothetical protein
MRNITGYSQVLIITAVFIVSRMIALSFGLHMDIRALAAYWQYLDMDTLKNHLLTGIWYDHAQPPLFNLCLGMVLKIGGSQTILLFTLILKLISLVNAILLFTIIKKIVRVEYIPLLITLIYIFSPATLVFENELFYTTFISLLLLISVFNMIRLVESCKSWHVFGVLFPLILLCMTRSVFHIFWLLLIIALLLLYCRKKPVLNILIQVSLAGIILVGSWYVKNKIIFGKFTNSTWLGMNLARNVFHDHEEKDSTLIEAYAPFSKISVYRKFVDPQFENRYQGLNNRDLLSELKNDSFINETEVSYIPVSDLYQKASIGYIGKHPGDYLKNVLQSSMLYFAPATIYSLGLEQTAKIKSYDLIYSFNLTYFSKSKQQRRILLTISAFPKLVFYLFVFFYMIRYCLRVRSIALWNLFIMITIGYLFAISSLFEHYENMRFRFETEPVFLILAAQVLGRLYFRLRKPADTPDDERITPNT